METLRKSAIVLIGIAALLAASPAFSQAYPSRPIRFIVPFPPGGAFDVLARTSGQKVSESIGQPVVVENKAGASGQIGTELAARAAPDGYTIVIVSTPFTISQASGKKMPYDALKDFAPISLMVLQPNVLLVNPGVTARSVGELIALAKAQPGKLTYAVGSVGSAPHLAGELLKSMAGIDLVRVFYNGAVPAQRALLAGEVTMLFDSPATWIGQIKAGKVNALGVTTRNRSPALPDVPSISETPGLADYFVDSFFGVVAPAGTPKPIVDRLSSEFARAFNTPDVHERLTGQGFTVVGSGGEEFGAFLRDQIANWRKIIELSGVKLD
jgi:tripartite-type tricarboxylate transporter receptor subunit TctC